MKKAILEAAALTLRIHLQVPKTMDVLACAKKVIDVQSKQAIDNPLLFVLLEDQKLSVLGSGRPERQVDTSIQGMTHQVELSGQIAVGRIEPLSWSTDVTKGRLVAFKISSSFKPIRRSSLLRISAGGLT